VSWYSAIAGGFEIHVLAVPRSSRSRVAGVHDDCLRIQLAAPPADGEANGALVELFVELLGVKKKSVAIVSGHGSRKKRVQVLGVSEDQIRTLIA
jgi:uncharacterized protein (TIGR00251 family)